MSGKIGAELGDMLNLKKTLDTSAEKSVELTTSVKGVLGTTTWEGPAADRFRQAWTSEFEPALKKLEQALKEAAGEVKRRHDALKEAGS